uniref:Cofilin n=1 Tax=Entamoeba invadens TaxID=33085 RepID=E1CFD9_ENTIV|nr:cofilin [Entamoeba invadens]
MSGIQLSDVVTSLYNEFKLSHKWRYILFKLNDKMTEIVVDKTAPFDETYEDFTKALPPKSARYGVYHLQYNQGSGKREKIIFYLWTPAACSIKEKMVYSATKATIKQAFVGLSVEIQATGYIELDEQHVIDKVKSVSQ